MARYGFSIPNGWLLELSNVPGAAAKWAAIRANVIEAEAAGFDSAFVVDHLHTFPRKQAEATFESFAVLTALAEATHRIRLGQMVTCNSYRNPALLAKVTACLDVISGGRLDVGIGAGWHEEEHRAYGYDFPRIGTRLGMMKEACEILKGLWTQERFSYAGRHYQLRDAVCEPKPLQKPHPPLLIGGQGEQVLLRHVARHASAWNANLPLEQYQRKVDILRRRCQEIGRDPDEIELTVTLPIAVIDHPDQLDQLLAESASRALPPDVLWRRYQRLGCVVGAPSEVAAKLRPWIEFGVGTIVCAFFDPIGRAQLKRFAAEVRPLL
jgi:F420-dependent oxidoreductase-like protein